MCWKYTKSVLLNILNEFIRGWVNFSPSLTFVTWADIKEILSGSNIQCLLGCVSVQYLNLLIGTLNIKNQSILWSIFTRQLDRYLWISPHGYLIGADRERSEKVLEPFLLVQKLKCYSFVSVPWKECPSWTSCFNCTIIQYFWNSCRFYNGYFNKR